MPRDDPRIIVFEGLDKSGKTTLARGLARFTRWRYVRALDPAYKHMLLSTDDPVEQARIVYASLAPKAWQCARSTTPCIFDRYAYSLAYQVARGLDPTIAIKILSRLPRVDVLVFIEGGVSGVPGAETGRVKEMYRALIDAVPPRSLYVVSDTLEAAATLARAGIVSASIAARLVGMRLPEFREACRRRGIVLYVVDEIFVE